MINELEFTVQELIIKDKYGIHARPAASIVKQCALYEEKIEIYLKKKEENADVECSCRSVIELLQLDAGNGTKLKLYVKGKDEKAKEIAKELSDLISSDFEQI